MNGTARTADLYLALAGTGWSDADISSMQAFIRAGGGVILGGQAWYWSYSKPVADYPANKLLAPFNAMALTAESTDAQGGTFKAFTALPLPLYKFNSDVAGAALAKHYAGTATLSAADLTDCALLCFRGRRGRLGYWKSVRVGLLLPWQIKAKQPHPPRLKSLQSLAVTTLVVAKIKIATLSDTPASFSSASTWRAYNSTLAKKALEAASQWDCKAKIDSSVGINKLAVRLCVPVLTALALKRTQNVKPF